MSVDPAKREEEFDRFAESYDQALSQGLSITGENREYFARGRLELLKKRLSEYGHAPGRILDYGCGDGASTPALLTIPGAEEVVGKDVSAVAIQRARRIHGGAKISFQTMDEQCVTGHSGAFDLVFCNGVFHHIPRAERASAVSFIFNSLRPGGLISLWENNPWNPGTKLVMSRIPFDKDAITLNFRETKEMLRAGGFEIVKIDFAFYFPRFLSFLRFAEGALRKIPFGAQYMVIGRKPKD